MKADLLWEDINQRRSLQCSIPPLLPSRCLTPQILFPPPVIQTSFLSPTTITTTFFSHSIFVNMDIFQEAKKTWLPRYDTPTPPWAKLYSPLPSTPAISSLYPLSILYCLPPHILQTHRLPKLSTLSLTIFNLENHIYIPLFCAVIPIWQPTPYQDYHTLPLPSQPQ